MTASPLAQKATDAFNAPICETDPEIAELLDSELGRQRSGLEMIASENFVPRAVLQCQGSVLTNKYAEGYPGRFYHAEAYGVNPETFRTDPEIIRQRTLDGAKILAERLLADDVKANGISVLTGGTDVHLVMVDLRNSEMDGQQGEDLLAACGITINRNTVPFDPRPASVASGLRIGTSALAPPRLRTEGIRGGGRHHRHRARRRPVRRRDRAEGPRRQARRRLPALPRPGPDSLIFCGCTQLPHQREPRLYPRLSSVQYGSKRAMRPIVGYSCFL